MITKQKISELQRQTIIRCTLLVLIYSEHGGSKAVSFTDFHFQNSCVLCLLVCLFVASVSQGQIYSDNCTCCHTEMEVADQTFYLTQSQYTHNGPTSPRADPITPGAWQGSHWSAWYDSTRKNPVASGNRTPDLPLSGRTPYFLANEVMRSA